MRKPANEAGLLYCICMKTYLLSVIIGKSIMLQLKVFPNSVTYRDFSVFRYLQGIRKYALNIRFYECYFPLCLLQCFMVCPAELQGRVQGVSESVAPPSEPEGRGRVTNTCSLEDVQAYVWQRKLFHKSSCIKCSASDWRLFDLVSHKGVNIYIANKHVYAK
jgi:hypothetical protein